MKVSFFLSEKIKSFIFSYMLTRMSTKPNCINLY